MKLIIGRISMKKIWISSVAYSIVSLGMVTGAQAETFTLNFDSLPSNQGWTYRGSPLAEADTFRVDGSSLVQTTVGSGNSTASYRIDNIINSSEPISLSFTARVLSYEMLTGGNIGWAFYIQIVDVTSILRLGFTDSSVVIQGEGFDLDTTTFMITFSNIFPTAITSFSLMGSYKRPEMSQA